mmetsp:Transcript_39468/g.75629  ORF Transcript_39468/g.75629 Transcript_39468/m.75629 type:complete len:234 (+) Transcript_39468:537-1238(+)
MVRMITSTHRYRNIHPNVTWRKESAVIGTKYGLASFVRGKRSPGLSIFNISWKVRMSFNMLSSNLIMERKMDCQVLASCAAGIGNSSVRGTSSGNFKSLKTHIQEYISRGWGLAVAFISGASMTRPCATTSSMRRRASSCPTFTFSSSCFSKAACLEGVLRARLNNQNFCSSSSVSSVSMGSLAPSAGPTASFTFANAFTSVLPAACTVLKSRTLRGLWARWVVSTHRAPSFH